MFQDGGFDFQGFSDRQFANREPGLFALVLLLS